MATKVNINGKIISRPGVYTLVKSGIKNNPVSLPAGNVVIIDDGIGAGYGAGKGGTLYTFDNVQDYQSFVKGGELWNLGAPLFKPLTGQNGVSKLYLVHARTTTPATIAFTIAAGLASFQTIDEGLNANGVTNSGDLRLGHAGTIEHINFSATTATINKSTFVAASVGVAQIDHITVTNPHVGDTFNVTIQGTLVSFVAQTTVVNDIYNGLAAAIAANVTLAALVTPSVSGGFLVVTAQATNTAFSDVTTVTPVTPLFVFKFWHGTYKGVDPLNNTPYDGTSEANAAPTLLFQTDPVATLDALSAWVQKNTAFQQVYKATIGTGSILHSDLAANVSYQLAAGGTESYGAPDFANAILAVKNADNNFFLATKYGTDVRHQNNLDIQSLIPTGKYERFLVVGGGALAVDYALVSKPAAIAYNDDHVILIHGDGKQTINNGFKRVSSLYKAAAALGRLAGIAVQTPLTFKQIGIDAEWDPLTEDQQNDALDFGVLVTYLDEELGYTVCLEDINTLQDNENLVNENATSFNIAVKRITAQLNKELAIYLKKKFFGNQNAGPNRNTVSADDLNAATEGFLQSRVASSITDNYILRFGNIVTTFNQDIAYVSYEFVPNFEVSKIIVTGVLLGS